MLAADRDVEHPAARELHRNDLDQTTRELGGLIGRVGLRHLDAVDETAREEVERDDLLVGLSGGDDRTRECGVAVALAETADEDVLAVHDRETGDAGESGGGVGIAVRLHVVRTHVVGDDRSALARGELGLSGGGDRVGVGLDRDLIGEGPHGETDVDFRRLGGADVDFHLPLLVARHHDLQFVGTGGKVHDIPAVGVRDDHGGPAHDFNRGARQSDRVLEVSHGAGHTDGFPGRCLGGLGRRLARKGRQYKDKKGEQGGAKSWFGHRAASLPARNDRPATETLLPCKRKEDGVTRTGLLCTPPCAGPSG